MFGIYVIHSVAFYFLRNVFINDITLHHAKMMQIGQLALKMMQKPVSSIVFCLASHSFKTSVVQAGRISSRINKMVAIIK